MIITLLWEPGSELTERVAARLPEHLTVLRPSGPAEAEELLGLLRVELVILEAPHLTGPLSQLFSHVRHLAPRACVLCAASPEALREAELAGGAGLELWVNGGSEAEIDRQIEHTLQGIELARVTEAAVPPPAQSSALSGTSAARTPAESALHRLLGALATGFDLGRLLDVYVDSVAELTGCGSYCLLWRSTVDEGYTVLRSVGLHQVIAKQGRLLPSDGLPTWYRRQRRVISRAQAGEGSSTDPLMAQIVREMDTFGGALAVPVLDGGRLWGILLLGEKVAAGSYGVGELETTFALSTQVAIAARDCELHQELARNKSYIDQIMATINAGVIVLGCDHKTILYNRWAEQLLGIPAEQVIGRDLRALPSPLGDFAYAALESGERREAYETRLPGSDRTLRLSTWQLTDDRQEPIGGLLFFEDVTTERLLARQKLEAERIALVDSIVARLAQQVRTPLSSIRTFAELLPTRYQQEDFREFWTSTVRKEVFHLEETITQMVSLIQEPTGRRERIAPQELLRRALKRLEETDEVAWCQTEVKENGAVPEVEVHAEATAEALLYLLQFARGQGKNWLEITVSPDGATEGAANITIGFVPRPGTPKGEELAELLDPLKALEQPESDLGPAVSRRILESQGGALQVVAENGKTRLEVLLPGQTSPTSILAEVS